MASSRRRQRQVSSSGANRRNESWVCGPMAALNLRVGLGYLDPVVKDRHGTDWGVSRESVIREQVWQEHARVSDRLIRKVALWTGVGHAPKWLRRRNGNERT